MKTEKQKLVLNFNCRSYHLQQKYRQLSTLNIDEQSSVSTLGKDREYASLQEAARANGLDVHVLNLSRSEDLKCKNLMCEKLDAVCICKLARYLVQNPFPNLYSMSLEGNAIQVLPEPIFDVVSLHSLNLRNNELVDIPESIERLVNLETLDLRDNKLRQLPKQIFALPKLKQVLMSGNQNLESCSILDSKQQDGGLEILDFDS